MKLPTDGPMDQTPKKNGWLCRSIFPAVILMLITTAVIAQPPTDDWKATELPKVESPDAASSAEEAKKIQQAFEGDLRNPTGDGLLDDVLNVRRKRGSVLDGSVLDWETDPLGDAVGPHSTAAGSARDRSKPIPGSANSFRLAEQLLATARRLEEADQGSKSSRAARIVSGDDVAKLQSEMLPVEKLVYQLRLRAVDLMQSGLNASSE